MSDSTQRENAAQRAQLLCGFAWSPNIVLMRQLVIATAAVLVGCGNESSVPVDAALDSGSASGPCWPDLVHVSRGSATLGTGRSAFEPMPADLPLEYGTQDGFMLIANVRMTGFAPGSETDIFDQSNPRTRVFAYFDETNVPLNATGHCPFRYGYKSVGGDQYELVQELPIIFDTCWRASNLIGQRIRVELELMNDEGGYATDTKVVTAAAPVFGGYPEDPGAPGCAQ